MLNGVCGRSETDAGAPWHPADVPSKPLIQEPSIQQRAGPSLFFPSLHCVTFHHVNFQPMAPATFSRRHVPAFPPICFKPHMFRSTWLFALGERLTCEKYLVTFYFGRHLKRCLFLEFLLVDAFANFAKEPLMPPTGDGWHDTKCVWYFWLSLLLSSLFFGAFIYLFFCMNNTLCADSKRSMSNMASTGFNS